MLKVGSVELSARWDWYEVAIVFDWSPTLVMEVSAVLVDRWDSNSDSHEWEIVSVDPPGQGIADVIEHSLSEITTAICSETV